ncbi:S9 family peptidase [Merismopedia glauca]|uniref:Peptidase n=1 Tax=Merismopedia glauca CCAP 1448/3 TaxID=1296344 RepID=A0A2T1C7Y0_9CYAN|nr:S9 family peptidase [Merismopedia glauca]PSB04334.1 peptidase [Merismopedia glauca CCAP 1448/3]
MISAPYGFWKSPITSDLIVSETIGLGSIAIDRDDIYWIEMRPAEAGRNVIVKRTPSTASTEIREVLDGKIEDVTPSPFNVRTRVHEYGGGAYTVAEGKIYFTNFADQRLYIQTPNSEPQPLTPESSGKLRYADLVVDAARNRLICIREDHRGEGEAVNTLVSINLEGESEGQILASGCDFYASPNLNPDCTQLAWITWNHPNLPWDGTQLWIAKIDPDGSLGEPQLVAGGVDESIFQPQWSPDGVLYFVSDKSGWWNLYRFNATGEIEPLYPMEAEFGLPQWVFGMSTYGFASGNRIICSYTQQGAWNLASLDLTSKQLQRIEVPYTDISGIKVSGNSVAFGGASPSQLTSLVSLDIQTGNISILQKSSQIDLHPGYISVPEAIAFPTENNLTAYAFYYPPTNKDYTAPAGEKPPLLVKSHGGPTAATSSRLSLTIQYWTSRGFAFLDVNYGGSTGYGREYHQRLDGKWGIVDVDDCTNGAKYLASQDKVDPNRLAIAGGSAGGYTTLCALTFRDTFKAGASYYGVSDLEALAKDTHKFEARYLDRLVAPYPERKDIYQERSPIYFTDSLACPVIFFQGLEDKVVPPNQAEMMVEALKAKGLPVAYVPFEGEQHGFRRAENIKRALDGELYFYSRVFGFTPAEEIEPVEIDNLG